jgi:hypothetical protein
MSMTFKEMMCSKKRKKKSGKQPNSLDLFEKKINDCSYTKKRKLNVHILGSMHTKRIIVYDDARDTVCKFYDFELPMFKTKREKEMAKEKDVHSFVIPLGIRKCDNTELIVVTRSKKSLKKDLKKSLCSITKLPNVIVENIILECVPCMWSSRITKLHW